ncbi:MAG: hypothetical protein IJS22_01750 [Lachnospiraceae bacterium]|nr:hypothetical protein [Lachnospiraceae bacterium]
MKLKKINAALGLLSILCMLMHIAYSAFAYLTMYYNPTLKWIFAIPFMVFVCLHAVCGMMTLFAGGEGGRLDLYPGKNVRTILQRVSAALIFPLLILHLYTFSLMQLCAQNGMKAFIILLMLAEILFFGTVITHVAVSFSNAFITLGLLTSEKTKKNLDTVMYVLGAAAFIVSCFAVIRGQVLMFLG